MSQGECETFRALDPMTDDASRCNMLAGNGIKQTGKWWALRNTLGTASALILLGVFGGGREEAMMSAHLPMILAVVLLGIWVIHVFDGRQQMRTGKQLAPAFILQWNILPLLVAVELLISTNPFLVLVSGGLFFYLCWPFARYLTHPVAMLCGLHVGVMMQAREVVEGWQVLAHALPISLLFGGLSLVIVGMMTLPWESLSSRKILGRVLFPLVPSPQNEAAHRLAGAPLNVEHQERLLTLM